MSNPVRQVNAAGSEGSDRSGANDVPRQGLGLEKHVSTKRTMLPLPMLVKSLVHFIADD